MIRHFQPGDILLLQRLGKQATSLNLERTLTEPRSVNRVAFTALMPWTTAKVMTYVLHQRHNALARNGLIQLRKRPNRPEADVVFLAPALDMADGHPAIWEKLLTHAVQDAVHHDVVRVYADIPDQSLPLNIFQRTGFSLYTRETVWRLPRTVQSFHPQVAGVRPQMESDSWNLQRLYAHVTPQPVQQAEGMSHVERGVKPPPLATWQPLAVRGYVLERDGELLGSMQAMEGKRGVWLRHWIDSRQRPTDVMELLLQKILIDLFQARPRKPVYIAVRDYHGGISAILQDFGFAPITDRARLVKYGMAAIKQPVGKLSPALDAVRDVLPTPLALPESSNPPWSVSQIEGSRTRPRES